MQTSLTDWWTIPTERASEFVEWQDQEYLPTLSHSSLFVDVSRYQVLKGQHTQVTWLDANHDALLSLGSGIDNQLPPLPIWLKILNGRARERFALRLHAAMGDFGSGAAPFRYIVQADIPDAIAPEYNAWYDEEHLPRLVSVPGIRCARRYLASDGSPRYLTAYDLETVDAFETPEALQARKTPWTEKMRSVFLNSRRTMLERK
ncbi:MAG: hypothetical protein M0Q54_10820 [Pigmentiphaga sp.]|nr:hypothetical protein [Pigmentiphaga sp.]